MLERMHLENFMSCNDCKSRFFRTVKTILTTLAGNLYQISPPFTSKMLLFWEHPFILVVETRDQAGKLSTGILLLSAKVVEVFFIEPQYFFFNLNWIVFCDFFCSSFVFFDSGFKYSKYSAGYFWTEENKSGVATQRAVEVVATQHSNT